MRPPQYEQGLRDLCKVIRQTLKTEDLTIVEVGSYAGESAVIWAQEFPQAKIYCIDPFEGGFDENDICSNVDYTEIEAEFDSRTKDYKNIIKLKKYSTEVIQYCDVLYLDGDHTYYGVKRDILHWNQYTKSIIAGHDYCDSPEYLAGVKKAVNELLGKPDCIFQDTSWLKFK